MSHLVTVDGGAAGAGAGEARRRRLEAARLYLIVEAEPGGRPAAEVVAPALAGGVDIVQLRDKEGGDEAIVSAARSLRSVCDEHDALLVLNDRPDLVLDSGADGVHLGQDDVSVDEARALLGSDSLVGLSTHSEEQIAAAGDSLADYIAVGPVHATPTKPGRPPVGVELVRHAARAAAKPFFAIGGLDESNVREVVGAGAERVAVVRAIRDAKDPRAAAEGLRRAVLEEARAGPAR